MREIIGRFQELLWVENVPARDYALELYQALEPAGEPDMWYWKDIDYSDQTWSFWCARKQYDRYIEHFEGLWQILPVGKRRIYEKNDRRLEILACERF